MPSKSKVCALCARDLPCTFHHLIPRSTHKLKKIRAQFTKEERNKGIWVCRNCHHTIHRFISNRDLAYHYASLEALLHHQGIKEYVSWAKKQKKLRFAVRTKKRD